MLHRYPITVAYSEEDACFIARVIGFRHLAAHGDTQEEAAKEARIALTGALKVLVAQGRELPQATVTKTICETMNGYANTMTKLGASGLNSSPH